MQYRIEIDGLRAIAVLSVILFHAKIFGFSGGYVGVDIFFVISGYLITSIILEEKNRNQFSLINFYERRARRILPALSIVLLFTTIMAFIFMPANLLKSYSQSLTYVATFTSNIFFYLTSSYFSTALDEKPLLHTWSLAIEEQYYIIFPIMVITLWGLGKKRLIYIIAFITVVSLLFSQYMSEIRDTTSSFYLIFHRVWYFLFGPLNTINANFYLIFSRAWELFFGSLIAFSNLDTIFIQKWKRETICIAGLSLIVYSIVFFDKNTPFPSFYTLIPILGTGAIIMFSNSKTYVDRVLSNRLFVATGLISYSLYLWHQPLFAFLRLKSIGEPSIIMFIGAIVLTFILSSLSYKFIETPFRNKSKISRSAIFQYSGTLIILIYLVGLCGNFYNGFEERFEYNVYKETIKSSPKSRECHTSGIEYLKPDKACKYFGKKITWASFGDSHTVEPAFALAKKLELDGTGLLHLSFNGCPPPALFLNVTISGCANWIKETLTYLENNTSIENVLLGFRYNLYLYGDQLDVYPKAKSQDPTWLFAASDRNMVTENPAEIHWQGLSKIITRLLNSGKTVYILYPIPELPIHISKAITPFSIFNQKTILDLKKSTSSDYYFSRNSFIISKLDTLQYGKNLHAIKPFEILCDSKYCPAVSNNIALYYDDDHLSVAGATKLIENSIHFDSKN